jgi:hypothetical protein
MHEEPRGEGKIELPLHTGWREPPWLNSFKGYSYGKSNEVLPGSLGTGDSAGRLAG